MDNQINIMATRDLDKLLMVRNGSSVGFVGSTWSVNPKTTRETFKEEFAKDYRGAMADYACVPVQGIDAFLKDPDLVAKRANYARCSPIDENDQFLNTFVPGPYEYYMHFDLGIRRDACGICLGHWDSKTKKVVIDLMMQKKPLPGQDLKFDSFRNIIYSLTERGFHIALITTDSWQSEEFRQVLMSKGYNVMKHSVDKDTTSYDTLHELLLANKIDFYPHSVFEFEMKHLVIVGKKVDHQDISTKDLSDAVAAVCYHCVSFARSTGDFEIDFVPLYAGMGSGEKNQIVSSVEVVDVDGAEDVVNDGTDEVEIANLGR